MGEIAGRTESPTPVIADLRSVGRTGPITMTDEEWAFFFGIHPEPPAVRRRWFRWVVAALIGGLLASSALIAWRVVIEDRGKVRDPSEIRSLAIREIDASPFGWLVTRVEVNPITNIDIGGFVMSAPADGVVVIDRRPWDEDELAAVVSHEMGHLFDFAAYQDATVARGGLESEVWAECSAVDAGLRELDGDGTSETYRCTPDELLVYRTALSLLGDVCRPWGGYECRPGPWLRELAE